MFPPIAHHPLCNVSHRNRYDCKRRFLCLNCNRRVLHRHNMWFARHEGWRYVAPKYCERLECTEWAAVQKVTEMTQRAGDLWLLLQTLPLPIFEELIPHVK